MIENIRFTMLIFVAQINLNIKIYILSSEKNVDIYKFSNGFFCHPSPFGELNMHINHLLIG